MRIRSRNGNNILISIILFLFAIVSPAWSFSLKEIMVSRATVSEGNQARLQNVFRKAEKGEPIVIGVIGGSITQGGAATSPEKSYARVLVDGWKRLFPKTKVTLVNAGIGATGSEYGAMRVRRDLLVHKPDLVIIEYAVNDNPTRECTETYEGVVRQILNAPESPALVLLFMTRLEDSSQETEARVGDHYSLPMVSFRNAILPAIKGGDLKWNELFADGVHPNDAGHFLVGDLLNKFFEKAYRVYKTGKSSALPVKVCGPLISDRYEHTLLLDRADLNPVMVKGWTFMSSDRTNLRWESSQPGSAIDFQIEGTDIFLYYWFVQGPMGKVSVSVDGASPTIIDAWFDQTWGGYIASKKIAQNLNSGRHLVHIQLLTDKNPRSTGYQFRILGLGGNSVKMVGRDPAYWPFDVEDPWNHPIGSDATYGVVQKGFYNSKSPNQATINCLKYSIPVYYALGEGPGSRSSNLVRRPGRAVFG